MRVTESDLHQLFVLNVALQVEPGVRESVGRGGAA